jgi:excisionase family DNA binding protein
VGELIRTGRAAAILGTSRQHVVDLVNRGVLANYGDGVQRRVDRSEVEALAGRPRPRDQRLRLWLHYAIAGSIVRSPARSMADIAANRDALSRAAIASGRSVERLLAWRRLLAQGPEAMLRAMTAESDVGDTLRRESPCLVVLTGTETRRLVQSFAITDRPPRRQRRQRERAWPRRRGLRGAGTGGGPPQLNGLTTMS